MPPGIEHLLREPAASLQIILILLALCWYVLGARDAGGHRRRRGPLALALVGTALLLGGYASEDVRAMELLVLCAGVVIPAVALTRERLQPGTLRGVRVLAVVVPVLAVGWMLVRGLVIPSVACAQHAVDHAVVHRQWELEYQALLALERIREERTGQSRLGPRDRARLRRDPAQIELLEAAGPPGGWAFSATAVDCDNCRSFYLDSDDQLRSARRSRATIRDRHLRWYELETLRGVIEDGCYVLGDVQCR